MLVFGTNLLVLANFKHIFEGKENLIEEIIAKILLALLIIIAVKIVVSIVGTIFAVKK